MNVFIDTNVLLRAIQPSDPSHDAAVRAIAALNPPAVVAEVWSAATRPREKNGLGMSSDQARQELAGLETFLTVFGETADVYRRGENSSRFTRSAAYMLMMPV